MAFVSAPAAVASPFLGASATRHPPRRGGAVGGSPRRPPSPHRASPPPRRSALHPPPIASAGAPALSGTILVVGASRGLGRHVVDALAAARPAGGGGGGGGGDGGDGGVVIHATTRAGAAPATAGTAIGEAPSRGGADGAADALSAVADGVTAVDVRERGDVAALLAAVRPTVVISCVGGTTLDERRPDYIGNQNVIDAAVDVGVARFVLVSAMGAGDSEHAVPFQAMDYMRPFFLDKSRAELYLKESGLPYTIVRPGPLEDGPPTGTGVVTESPTGYGGIVRADLAALLVGAAASPRAAGKTLTAVDRTKVLLTSPYVRPLEFWEELPFTPFSLGG